jgi:hypothetical protein
MLTKYPSHAPSIIVLPRYTTEVNGRFIMVDGNLSPAALQDTTYAWLSHFAFRSWVSRDQDAHGRHQTVIKTHNDHRNVQLEASFMILQRSLRRLHVTHDGGASLVLVLVDGTWPKSQGMQGYALLFP